MCLVVVDFVDVGYDRRVTVTDRGFTLNRGSNLVAALALIFNLPVGGERDRLPGICYIPIIYLV